MKRGLPIFLSLLFILFTHKLLFSPSAFRFLSISLILGHHIIFDLFTFSFSITVGGPLDIRSPLFPNQCSEVALPLKVEGLAQPMNPPNCIQVAVKTSAGIIYFQTYIPLHVLFMEDGPLEQQVWLKMWREDLSQQGEKKDQVEGLSISHIDRLRHKLQINNVFTVAERNIDDVVRSLQLALLLRSLINI